MHFLTTTSLPFASSHQSIGDHFINLRSFNRIFWKQNDMSEPGNMNQFRVSSDGVKHISLILWQIISPDGFNSRSLN